MLMWNKATRKKLGKEIKEPQKEINKEKGLKLVWKKWREE